jgi:Ala-tRNA(Pro) deacylase
MQITEYLDKSAIQYEMSKHEPTFTAQEMAAVEHEPGKYVAVDLADEKEIGSIFEDCELGAEPPFGNLYDMPVIMDKALEKDDHIKFQAGTHEKAIRMSMEDYRKLVNPKVLEFSYHMSS